MDLKHKKIKQKINLNLNSYHFLKLRKVLKKLILKKENKKEIVEMKIEFYMI